VSEQTSVHSKAQGHGNLLILLFAGFVLTGVATVIIGPMLPRFIQKWSLDDGQAGLFFPTQFTAAMAGTVLSSVLSSWRGYRTALVMGYVLTGVGLAILDARSYPLALVAVGSIGCGYGMLVPGTNLLVAEAGGARSASLLNLVNFSWGVGAVVCSPLVFLALKHRRLFAFLTGLAIFAGLIVLGLLFARFDVEKHKDAANDAETDPMKTGLAVSIALAALFFIYVGTETGIGGWAAEYAKRLAKGATGLTTMAPMFFYGGLISGRAAAPLVLLRVQERPLVLSALGLTATGATLLIASPALKLAILGIFLAGLGCASIYPIYIAWLSRWYGPSAKRIGGIFFALASLGGAFGPWMVGIVSKHTASLRVGLLVPLVSALVMICLVALLRRRAAA
jgi:MFS transporter, FHS family, glucose/mannose:H+ symporter